MLKIDERLKFKDLPKYISEQLFYIETFNIRASIFITTFVMLDLMVVLPLLVPLIPIYLYILVPPLLLFHIWSMRIMIKNPYSVQYETILFFAIWGVLSTIVFAVLSQKMAFYLIGIKGFSYYLITTVLFLVAVGSILNYRLSRYRDLSYDAIKLAKKKERELKRKAGKEHYPLIITFVPGLGYMVAQMIKHNETFVYCMLVIIFWGFAVFCSYVAIKFIQRSFMLKVNKGIAPLQTPSKKAYKLGLVKKGMKIK